MKVTLHLSLVSIAIAVSILSPLSSFAQPPTSQEWTAMINSLSGKQEISAQAASFQKFGSYSVSLATGVPDVSIPIYTIKSGELEFPITLSYHMGGYKGRRNPHVGGSGMESECRRSDKPYYQGESGRII